MGKRLLAKKRLPFLSGKGAELITVGGGGGGGGGVDRSFYGNHN